MKKTYIKPKTKWLQAFGDEDLMQNTSLNVNDKSDDDEVDDFDDLLSKPTHSVWDDLQLKDQN